MSIAPVILTISQVYKSRARCPAGPPVMVGQRRHYRSAQSMIVAHFAEKQEDLSPSGLCLCWHRAAEAVVALVVACSFAYVPVSKQGSNYT